MKQGFDFFNKISQEYANVDSIDDLHYHKPLGEQMFGCFFDLLLKLFLKPSCCGEISVSSGQQETKIFTGFHPSEVFISFDEYKGKTTCSPYDDMFDIRIIPHGFVLVSKTSSPQRLIKWKAIGR